MTINTKIQSMLSKFRRYDALFTETEREGLFRGNLHRQICWELLNEDGKLDNRFASFIQDLQFLNEEISLLSWLKRPRSRILIRLLIREATRLENARIPAPYEHLVQMRKGNRYMYRIERLTHKQEDDDIFYSKKVSEHNKLTYFLKRFRRGSRLPPDKWKLIENFYVTQKEPDNPFWFMLPLPRRLGKSRDYSWNQIKHWLRIEVPNRSKSKTI